MERDRYFLARARKLQEMAARAHRESVNLFMLAAVCSAHNRATCLERAAWCQIDSAIAYSIVRDYMGIVTDEPY